MILFDQVLNNNTSGSGDIVNQVQEALLDQMKSKRLIRLQDLYSGFQQLRSRFPQFGILFHFLKSFDEAFRGKFEIEYPEIRSFIIDYRGQWANVQQNVIKQFCDEVDLTGKTVLLHSNSSTIHHLFEQAVVQIQTPSVYQTLSSPANEGLIQAKALSKMGFDIRLFHEDALSKYISYVDLVILGADLILDDLFLNKIGSFSIALLCRYFGKPVYVIADRRKKFTANDFSAGELALIHNERTKPLYEIANENPEGIQIFNEYFEFTPLNLVEKLFL